MIRLRHRKWLHRSFLLAMLALLWSQFALAGHDDCLDIPSLSADIAASADTHHGHSHDHGRDTEPPSTNNALCDAHCSTGDASADSNRIPLVPALFEGAWLPWLAVADIANGVPVAASAWADSPPKPAWHRPTAHPATLLLI